MTQLGFSVRHVICTGKSSEWSLIHAGKWTEWSLIHAGKRTEWSLIHAGKWTEWSLIWSVRVITKSDDHKAGVRSITSMITD